MPDKDGWFGSVGIVKSFKKKVKAFPVRLCFQFRLFGDIDKLKTYFSSRAEENKIGKKQNNTQQIGT